MAEVTKLEIGDFVTAYEALRNVLREEFVRTGTHRRDVYLSRSDYAALVDVMRHTMYFKEESESGREYGCFPGYAHGVRVFYDTSDINTAPPTP